MNTLEVCVTVQRIAIAYGAHQNYRLHDARKSIVLTLPAGPFAEALTPCVIQEIDNWMGLGYCCEVYGRAVTLWLDDVPSQS